MAASGVELAAFNGGWHVSFVSRRGILRVEVGIEDAVIELLILCVKPSATMAKLFSAYFLLPI